MNDHVPREFIPQPIKGFNRLCSDAERLLRVAQERRRTRLKRLKTRGYIEDETNTIASLCCTSLMLYTMSIEVAVDELVAQQVPHSADAEEVWKSRKREAKEKWKWLIRFLNRGK